MQYGKRLKKEALSVTINNITIDEFTSMSIEDAAKFIENLSLTKKEETIAFESSIKNSTFFYIFFH